MSTSNDINSNASDSMAKVKKTKVKENWDDESEEESDVEIECADSTASEEVIKDKEVVEHYEKNKPEYEDYEYGGNLEDAEESDYDYDDYEEIDKKLGNHFRLH